MTCPYWGEYLYKTHHAIIFSTVLWWKLSCSLLCIHSCSYPMGTHALHLILWQESFPSPFPFRHKLQNEPFPESLYKWQILHEYLVNCYMCDLQSVPCSHMIFLLFKEMHFWYMNNLRDFIYIYFFNWNGTSSLYLVSYICRLRFLNPSLRLFSYFGTFTNNKDVVICSSWSLTKVSRVEVKKWEQTSWLEKWKFISVIFQPSWLNSTYLNISYQWNQALVLYFHYLG